MKTKKTKILILIPLWKRPEVFQICAQNLDFFIQHPKLRMAWDVTVLCIISPEDPDITALNNYCTWYNFKTCYYRNYPTGEKINAGINFALDKEIPFDYLMNFGSDDLIHANIVDLYKPLIQKDIKFFGINNLYFHELNTKKTFHFHTYNDLKSIGAGRFIHRSMLEQFRLKKVELYTWDICMGMDSNSAYNILKYLAVTDVVVDAGKFPYIVDIKTNTNINHITAIESRAELINYVDNDYLKTYFFI